MARIVVLVPDLLFGSKVVSMLEAAGHEVTLTAQEDDARTEAEFADVLVVDLTTDAIDGVMLVDSMGAGGELRGHRTLGFYSHVETDVPARAREAGFDLVVPRSRMAREGVDLVERLAAGAQTYGELRPDVLREWADWDVEFGILKRRPDFTEAFDTTLVGPAPLP